jgi:hypothetical protein
VRQSKDAQPYGEKKYREMGIFWQGTANGPVRQNQPGGLTNGLRAYLLLGIFYGIIKKAAYLFVWNNQHCIA